MSQKERLAQILKILEKQQTISQEEMISIFAISKDTARRDIVKLVDSGLVERYPGGVSLPVLKAKIEDYSNRLIKNAGDKKRIAEKASSLLGSNMTIYLDVSTTVNFLASAIDKKEVAIVTNSIDNAMSVNRKVSKQVYLLGGFLNADSHLISGASVLQQLQRFNFDYAFIGGGGITEQGVFYSELTDISLKEEIISNSQKVCLLVDGTKINKVTGYKLDFSGIDIIITNRIFPGDVLSKLTSLGIEVINIGEGIA